MISICLIFSSILSFAQENNVQVKWGKKQRLGKNTSLGNPVAFEDGNLYMLKRKPRKLFSKTAKYEIARYNDNMALEKILPLELKEGKKWKTLDQVVYMKEEMVLFSSFKNQKLKKNFLFFQTIDKKTLKPNNDLKKIAEIDYSDNSRYNAGNYGFEMSRDSTKFMVYYNLPYNKKEKEKFGFHVYDQQMNTLWNKNITLPYTDKLFHVGDYELDNEGNVHIIGRIFKDRVKLERFGKPNYKFEILSYYDQGNSLEKYQIQTEDKFLTDMQIAISDEQNIICSGFYSDEGTYSVKGSFFFKIDRESKAIISKNYSEFSIDFITQHMKPGKQKRIKKRAKKGKNRELYEYDLRDIIIKDDGGIVMIAEQFYIRVVTNTRTNSNGITATTTSYHYYYNDIIVVNISADGTFKWTEKIAKKQHTVNDDGHYSSYDVAVVGDKLHFIFNDHKKNMEYKGDGKRLRYYKGKKSKSLAVMVTLDANGKQSKKALFSVKDKKMYLRPKFCKQLLANQVLVYGQKGRNHYLGKMTFVD